MSRAGPTIEELRATVQKERYREIGNWLARRVARPSAVYGTWLAIRLGLSAHQVTLLAWLAGLAASVALASGTRTGFVASVALAHLAFWLDHVDGQVARWRGTASLDGVYLDYLMHHVTNLGLGFALGYGLAARTGDPAWAAAGFAIALGWGTLALHNDCRYKAFFQRLKRAGETYVVEGGSGGRPAPAAPWSLRGRSALTWPAYKACEPHVVLLGLTALALAAVADQAAWAWLWRRGVRLMAMLAPALACGRVARAVLRRSVEAEFGLWFRPLDSRDPSRTIGPRGDVPPRDLTDAPPCPPTPPRASTTSPPGPRTARSGSASWVPASSSGIATSSPMPARGSGSSA